MNNYNFCFLMYRLTLYVLSLNPLPVFSTPTFSVLCSVRDLSSFIQATASGLTNKVGDYEGLVAIMGHLMAIRDRQISNEQHFKPLKSTTELLKTYGQQLPENIYMQLEVSANTQIHTDRYIYHLITFLSSSTTNPQELPERWKNLGKIAFTVKHEVAPLQSNEVSVIRRKCVWFEVSLCVSRVEYQH